MPVEVNPTTLSQIKRVATKVKIDDRIIRKTQLEIIRKNFKAVYPMKYISLKPIILTCPSCLNVNVPGRMYVKNDETFKASLILAPVLLFWLPNHSKKFKSCVHFCPDCRILLGIAPYLGIFKKKT